VRDARSRGRPPRPRRDLRRPHDVLREESGRGHARLPPPRSRGPRGLVHGAARLRRADVLPAGPRERRGRGARDREGGRRRRREGRQVMRRALLVAAAIAPLSLALLAVRGSAGPAPAPASGLAVRIESPRGGQTSERVLAVKGSVAGYKGTRLALVLNGIPL